MPYPTTNTSDKPIAAPLPRRDFLKLALLSSTALGLVSPFLSANTTPAAATANANATTSNKLKAGLQLYTVRDLMAQDVAETLKLVSAVGYQELEFAGYFNQSAKNLRKLMNSEGLTAPSCHVPLSALTTDLENVITSALEIGHQYLVLPYLTEAERGTDIGSYQRLAAQLNIIGERCQQAGLQLAYHNHAFEFEPVPKSSSGTALPYDVLLTETEPALVKMELDLYWTVKAGVDPAALFNTHPGRFPLWHVKDMDKSGNFADLGQGVIDFKQIYTQAKQAGLKHNFVERDETPNKIETIRRGFAALSNLIT